MSSKYDTLKTLAAQRTRMFAAASEMLTALRAQDDLERLIWIRDNDQPASLGVLYLADFQEICARYPDVLDPSIDSWELLIGRLDTHSRELREAVLAKVASSEGGEGGTV